MHTSYNNTIIQYTTRLLPLFISPSCHPPTTGPAVLEFVLLPCLERALEFTEPPVVAAAASCLTQLAAHLRLRKPALLRGTALLLPRLLQVTEVLLRVHECISI